MERKERAKGTIDWDQIERDYVNSDKDLYLFSRENTGNTYHPSLSTLQQKYYDRNWARLRAARVQHELVQAEGKNNALRDEEVMKVTLLAREDLLNATQAIERHLRLSRSLQDIAGSLVQSAQKAVGFIDLEEMAANDPKGFIAAVKIITDLTAASTELERKCLGAADIKIEFNVIPDSDRDTTAKKIEALKDMDQSELLKRYMDSLNG